jgi:hypothetical protein
MNLMPLADRLQASGLGTQGKNIFLNMMPSEAESAILLRNPLSGTKINYELPAYFRTQFQLIVRGSNYVAALAVMNQAIAALTMTNFQLETLYFNYSRPHADPVSFPLSKGNLIEFNVMFDVNFIDASGP